MKPNNQLFEVRIVLDNKKNYSGYFKDADTLIKALKESRIKEGNVYITLSTLDPACYDRQQKNTFLMNPKTTTSDNDVLGYDWLMIDLDPKRPSGTSSTDEQIEKAKSLGNEIYVFLQNLGFCKPITALSGNGVHLMYRIHIKNSDENKKIIEKCLKTINMLFSNDEIDVDMKNFNPARICKLYGTMAQKGSNTEERPHRLSYIIGEYQQVNFTDIGYLKKLCELYPDKPDRPQRYNSYNGETFNLEDWMSKHGLNYRKSKYADGDKYILDCCPFDSNHKGKDACIFQGRNGALSFHCFHNSCADKGWRDVRILYEPDAYEKRQKEKEKIQYGSFNRNKVKESTPIVQQDNKPIFFNAQGILDIPKAEETFVKTGYTDIDKKLRGLKKGFTSVWSGLRGSGKSSVLSQLGLDARQAGNNVGYFSGELAPKNFMRWMNQQAAGKSGVEPGAYEGYYNVPIQRQKEIAEWLGDHMWLYNNDYGNDSVAILEQFEKAIDEKKLDMLILDNLMAFDITTMSADKYEAQKMFVWKLHEMAQKYDTHIAFVAHPRKSMGFLRLDDISGSADIANAVEYAFIVHRNNNDFKRLSKDMFGWKESEPVYSGTNVIEICKDRDGGTQDYFIPLFYEIESKRLKNDPSENKIYGWDKRADHVYGFDAINFDVEETPFD